MLNKAILGTVWVKLIFRRPPCPEEVEYLIERIYVVDEVSFTCISASAPELVAPCQLQLISRAS